MRLVIVWIIAGILLFTTTLSWYCTIPVVVGIARALNSTTYGNPSARNVCTLIEFGSYIWGPLFCLFIIAWAYLNSQSRDIESEMYG